MLVLGCTGSPLGPRGDLVQVATPTAGRTESRVRMRRVDVTGQLDGRLARVEALITFHNPDAVETAAEVTLPLPAGAVVDGVDVDLHGELSEDPFRGAGALRRDDDGVLRLRVFPVPAHGSRLARVRYHYRLPLDDLRVARLRVEPPAGLPLERFEAEVRRGDGQLEKSKDVALSVPIALDDEDVGQPEPAQSVLPVTTELALRQSRVEAHVRGRHATIEFTATLRNPGETPRGGLLEFRLPDDAAVDVLEPAGAAWRGAPGWLRLPIPILGSGGEVPVRVRLYAQLEVGPEGMRFAFLPPSGARLDGPIAWQVAGRQGNATAAVEVRLPLSKATSFCAPGLEDEGLVCHVEVIAPPLLRGAAPRFAVAVDTSASVPEEASHALVRALAAELPGDTPVLAGDATVRPCTLAAPTCLAVPHGGATDLGALLARARATSAEATLLISDGRVTLGERSVAGLVALAGRPVLAVAVGPAPDQAALADLAERTRGFALRLRFAEDAPTISRALLAWASEPTWAIEAAVDGDVGLAVAGLGGLPLAALLHVPGPMMLRPVARQPGGQVPLAGIRLEAGPPDPGLVARWAVAELERLTRRVRADALALAASQAGLIAPWTSRLAFTPAAPPLVQGLEVPSPSFVGPLPAPATAALEAPQDARAAAVLVGLDPDGAGYRRATEVLEAAPMDGVAATALARALGASKAREAVAERVCALVRGALADQAPGAWALAEQLPTCALQAMADFPGNPSFFLMIQGEPAGPVRVLDGAREAGVKVLSRLPWVGVVERTSDGSVTVEAFGASRVVGWRGGLGDAAPSPIDVPLVEGRATLTAAPPDPG